jgi:hypothetical protein
MPSVPAPLPAGVAEWLQWLRRLQQIADRATQSQMTVRFLVRLTQRSRFLEADHQKGNVAPNICGSDSRGGAWHPGFTQDIDQTV